MKKFFTLAALSFFSFSFSQIQAYKDRADAVSQTNLETYNSDLVAFGVRKTGTQQTANALAYLKDKYASFGYTDIAEQTFTRYSSSFGTTFIDKNLIVTKTGKKYPDQYVIICGHYDSYSNDSTGKQSVGANDNASGVAVILEVARILKNIPTEYSIKFINFSGEEQGLLGSYEFVNQVVNSTNPKMNIKLVLNLDQVGGMANRTNNTVVCEADKYNNTTVGRVSTNDDASLSATLSLKDYFSYYTSLTGVLDYAYGSDYMPFEYNGEVITGIYERPTDSRGRVVTNTYYHNNTDIINNLSYPYIYQIAKGATGAMQHFAVADQTTVVLPTQEVNKLSNYKIYPNPAKETIFIDVPNTSKYEVSIIDVSGKVLVKEKGSKTISTNKLQNGLYIAVMKTDKETVHQKIIV